MASVVAPPTPTSPQQATSASPAVSPQKVNTSLSGVERHRFTVAQYHDIIKQGIFSEDEPVELIRERLLITETSDGILAPLLLPDVSLRVDEILTPSQPQAPG